MAAARVKVPAGEKITISHGKLQVPDHPIVAFIEGDGTGPDIWAASVRVLDAAVAQAYKGRVQFVGVAIDASRSGALSYTRRYGWHWPIVFDPHDHLVEPFGLLGKPTTFVLDSSGRVAWKLQRELSRDELTTALDDVLGQ